MNLLKMSPAHPHAVYAGGFLPGMAHYLGLASKWRQRRTSYTKKSFKKHVEKIIVSGEIFPGICSW
jgi:hypothetical protein